MRQISGEGTYVLKKLDASLVYIGVPNVAMSQDGGLAGRGRYSKRCRLFGLFGFIRRQLRPDFYSVDSHCYFLADEVHKELEGASIQFTRNNEGVFHQSTAFIGSPE